MGDLIFLSRDDLQYVLDGLSHRENKQHFRQSLLKAVAAGPRMAPYLLRWLDSVIESPGVAAQFGNPLKTTAALFILASLQERSALSSVVRLMQIEDPSFCDLLEEEGIDSASRILAALSEADDLMALASDPDNPLELRENCIDALLLHFTQDQIEFEELADFLYSQWRNFRASDYEYWRTCLLTSFYVADERHYDDIRLQAPKIKESYRQDLLQMLKQSEPPDGGTVRASLFANPEFQPIRDPVAELRDMAVFEMIESIAADIEAGRGTDDEETEDSLNPELSYRFLLKCCEESDFACAIELLDAHDLHDLHLAIQEGLKWDADHCYSFFLDNRFKNSEQAYESTSDGGEDTLVQLANFDFYVGQEFAYLFDWSDERRFVLRVEALLPLGERDPESFVPVIVSQGTPPVQYKNRPRLS